MVIRDLSYSEAQPANSKNFQEKPALPLAPVSDRFVAFILDFLILSPIVSFCVSMLLRDLKTVLILNSDSDAAGILWIFFVISIIALSSLLQSVFLFFWGATPGQKFMQLSVVSYPQWMDPREKLTFAQSLLRPLGWWGCALMAGIPFLDVVGHPLRRAIHERMSDTMVISHKDIPVDRPLLVETRYISSTLWVFYGFLFFIGLTFMAKTYKSALVEVISGNTAVAEAACSQIPAETYKGQSRLDMAMALYFAGEAENECVYTEAQKVIWTAKGESKALGELAMALISDDQKEVDQYHKKACATSERSEACAISKFLTSENSQRGVLLRQSGMALLSTRVLMLGSSLETGSYVAAAGLVKDLETEAPLKTFVEKNRVQIAWALNEKLSKVKNREPASSDEKEILKDFKERYKIQ